MSERNSMVIQLVSLIALVSIALFMAACGGDDPPNGGGDATVVVSISGAIVKGEMGEAATINFAARDNSGTGIAGKALTFGIVAGDGTLSAVSDTTNSSGTATVSYTFDGARGDAVVRAILPGKDTVTVMLRAMTLIPGTDGHAQYVLYSDLWRDIVAINGDPASQDALPGFTVIYANYQTALGFVPAMERFGTEATIRDTAEIKWIIINTVCPAVTADSIGVGSYYHRGIAAAYGIPDSIWIDGNYPNERIIDYAAEGLRFFTELPDTTVFEIHFSQPPEANPAAPAGLPSVPTTLKHIRERQSF